MTDQPSSITPTYPSQPDTQIKDQCLGWDELSCAGCSLSFSDQDPQSGVCCLLFALLLVGRTHWWEPATPQLGLVGEPRKAKKQNNKSPFRDTDSYKYLLMVVTTPTPGHRGGFTHFGSWGGPDWPTSRISAAKPRALAYSRSPDTALLFR